MTADPNEASFNSRVVAWLNIRMTRDGAMRFEGTITDYRSLLAMLDTARASILENMKADQAGRIHVPGYDTALVGTEHEKKLLKAVEDLCVAKDKAS